MQLLKHLLVYVDDADIEQTHENSSDDDDFNANTKILANFQVKRNTKNVKGIIIKCMTRNI